MNWDDFDTPADKVVKPEVNTEAKAVNEERPLNELRVETNDPKDPLARARAS